jgi:hypothetical protein
LHRDEPLAPHEAKRDLAQLLQARSRCRCGRGEPGPGAEVAGRSADDVAGVSPGPGADVGGVSPGPSADVGGVSPAPVQMRAAGQNANFCQRSTIAAVGCVEPASKNRTGR